MGSKRTFWEQVTVHPKSRCWFWIGPGKGEGNGYGKSYGGEYAHRASYKKFVGTIPSDMQVLHRCDVPRCVNPNHLFLGTQRDNMLDMHAKYRAAGKRRFGTRKKYCLNPKDFRV